MLLRPKPHFRLVLAFELVVLLALLFILGIRVVLD